MRTLYYYYYHYKRMCRLEQSSRRLRQFSLVCLGTMSIIFTIIYFYFYDAAVLLEFFLIINFYFFIVINKTNCHKVINDLVDLNDQLYFLSMDHYFMDDNDTMQDDVDLDCFLVMEACKSSCYMFCAPNY